MRCTARDAMDRLPARSENAVDELLRSLADADVTLDRRRRRRRWAVDAVVVAGLACWTASRFGLPRIGAATILFVVCGLAALSLALVERRARRRRERIAARVPAEQWP